MINTENNNPPPPTQDLKALIKELGFSLPNFARRRGYGYVTVFTTLKRWGHRTDRQPHGGIARQIMADLRAEVLSASHGIASVSPAGTPAHSVPNSGRQVGNRKFPTCEAVPNSQGIDR